MKSLRIALAQINTTVGDLAGNLAKVSDGINRAKAQGADIVVFPELAVTGYPPEDLLYKEKFVPDNIRALRSLARKVRGITAIVGFVDSHKKNLYNAAAVIADSKVRGVYHKRALPNYGVFDEKRYFAEGEQNPVFVLGGVTFGVNICEDFWRSNGAPAVQVRSGAKILLNISASPFDYSKLEQRKELLAAFAREHKVYVGYVNLVGGQDELVFDGASLVLDPAGKIIAAAEQFDEDLLLVDIPCPPKSAAKKSGVKKIILPAAASTALPAMTGKKVAALTKIERIYRALVLGTRDYVRKNGFKKVLVGLSGGIDSALVAAIACDAVGRDNVVGITMPTQFTSAGTRNDAGILANNLGMEFKEIAIQPIFESYLATLKGAFGDLPRDVAEENIQARIRGNILMAFSNKFGWLVLTTGNKSEVAVGYCTLYGDMSGGFAVIKDVPKTTVYKLAELVNSRTPGLIPQSIIDRAPTAELRENQKDQDSLPPYDVLDELLSGYVERHKSLANFKTVDKALAQRIVRLVDSSEYKRRQAPPGIKITTRAFGKDWRLPLTNKYKEF